jgi:hypothetical protein
MLMQVLRIIGVLLLMGVVLVMVQSWSGTYEFWYGDESTRVAINGRRDLL